MAKFTIVKSADIALVQLTSAGQRAGADSGDPQIAVKKIAPEAVGNLGIWECQPGGWPVKIRYVSAPRPNTSNRVASESGFPNSGAR